MGRYRTNRLIQIQQGAFKLAAVQTRSMSRWQIYVTSLFLVIGNSTIATTQIHHVYPGQIHSAPLAPPSPPADAQPYSPMFEDLPPQQTGIDFVYQWKHAVLQKYDFENLMLPAGVCIGDYDRDGLPDIFLTRPSGGSRLYKNLGGFRFRDVTTSANILADDVWTTGASFADIDNDGDLDLYVCVFEGSNLLFINQGDGTFKEQAKTAGVDYKGPSVMVAFSDYDRDGDLDAYLLTNSRKTSEVITRMQEIRQKVVAKKGNDPLVRGPNGQVIDIRPELKDVMHLIRAGQNIMIAPRGEKDRLYRNEGNGTFRDVTQSCGINDTDFGLSATWWDYNNDHWPDVYVANDFMGSDRLYRNNQDGTFTDVISQTVPHTPWFSMGSDVADLNNDGRLDFMATDMSATTHYKQKISMGNMESRKWFLVSAVPRQYMRNAVYLNTGTDRFMEVAHLSGLANTDWTWAIKFADLDNDGWNDLFVSNGMTRDWTNSDLDQQVNKLGGENSPAAIQFWLDQPVKQEGNLAFKNLGKLEFKKVSERWGLGKSAVSFGSALGDLDLDGDLDLVVNNFENPPSIYRNRSISGHRIMLRLIGNISNRDGIGALVQIKTEDGIQTRYFTLSRGFMSSDEPLMHFGLADHKNIERLTVLWPNGQRQLFENLPTDCSYTIYESATSLAQTPLSTTTQTIYRQQNHLTPIRHQEAVFDDYKRQPLLPYKLSRLGPGMAWGDIDLDGDDDLYMAGAAGTDGLLYLNQDGVLIAGKDRLTKSNSHIKDLMHEDMGSLFFDADSDGDIDLYVTSGGVELDPGDDALRDRLYLNNGHGQFTKASTTHLPDLHDSASVVAGADFDRDGDIDLFVGSRSIPGQYPLTPNSRLLINHQGRFSDQTDALAPGDPSRTTTGLRQTGLVTGALWSDVDHDGWLDLLVTHDWGPIKLYKNHQGLLEDQTFEAGLASHHGWWNGLTGRDLDGDGDIDYIATNFGLNTPYHASEDKPALLYYGDFRPDGNPNNQPRLVEATFEDNKIYPWRGKSCSTNAMPFLANKFPRFHDFAEASLNTIYTGQRLATARRFTATTLESSVLINDGQGGFIFKPLPRIAQVSPGFGVVITEVNGDHHADLYIVQNFFSPQPETGRFDGGLSLLLHGQGDGEFEPIWPDQSGLIAPGDAKSLTVTDLNGDGWPDFVVGNNNGPLQTFVHQGDSHNRLLQIRLQGPNGNPTAIGSRVTVQIQGGVPQTAEIYAGSGYLSQSSNALYFGVGRSARSGKISVRWPNGFITTQIVTTNEQSITIKYP